jgi:YtkA-like protein
MSMQAGRLGQAHAAGAARWEDRIARGVILAGGLLVLLLMAWGHFGLGALLAPPPANAPTQMASAGAYRVALRAGALTARGPNTLTFAVTDRAGHQLSRASVRVDPWMVAMPMRARAVDATVARGQWVAHPVFGMAGSWRLVVTITPDGQPPVSATFAVGVRWS